MPTYQPLGQSRDDVRHESCHSTYRQRTMPRPDHKGAKQGFAILDLAETLVGGASCQAMAAGVLGPPVVYGLAGMC